MKKGPVAFGSNTVIILMIMTVSLSFNLFQYLNCHSPSRAGPVMSQHQFQMQGLAQVQKYEEENKRSMPTKPMRSAEPEQAPEKDEDDDEEEDGSTQSETIGTAASEDDDSKGGAVATTDPYQWINKEGAGKKILLDVGANCGNSYKKLQKKARWERAEPFEEAYLFEWNPRIIKLYLNALAKDDPRVTVIPNPVWGEDDPDFTMNMDAKDEKLSDEEVLKKFPCTSSKINTFNSPFDSSSILGDYYRAGTPMKVKALGLAKWFKEQNFAREDKIFLKIDIEGAECNVIDSWMDAGLVCAIQTYYVEWHPHFTEDVKKCVAVTKTRLEELAAKCDHDIPIHLW